MVHRDVKPDNILLTADGTIKVADLGLAKQLDEDMDLTKTGAGAGTPMYMAPEQARDVKHVDRRCDIYSLGCMLYVFLTGHTPFGGATLVEVISAKEKGKFQPIAPVQRRRARAARPHRGQDARRPAGTPLRHVRRADRRAGAARPGPRPPQFHRGRRPSRTARPAPTMRTRPAKMTQHDARAGRADAGRRRLVSEAAGPARTVKKLTGEQIRTMLRRRQPPCRGAGQPRPEDRFPGPRDVQRVPGPPPRPAIEGEGREEGGADEGPVPRAGTGRRPPPQVEVAPQPRRRPGNTLVGLLWIGLLLAVLAIGTYSFTSR